MDIQTRNKLQNALKERDKKRKDKRYLNVMDFLNAKGLLFTDNIKHSRKSKLKIKDALWVAENIEPRVLEVLPAAILHFPKVFADYQTMPAEIKNVVAALKKQLQNGPNLRWVSFETLKRWANHTTSDGRVRPLEEKRIARTFRLRRETIDHIKQLAKQSSISEGSVIDNQFKHARCQQLSPKKQKEIN